ncbi:GntR family transcriptional regulator [Enterococcus asini]|uniref:GntR family transcriptional regulator n=1 Tax=Enterococcus asini TaxID=57732 RepID=UPI00288E396D|nr:GntR family transcriptional regulator [Enterococcus asini]MDT2756516.1 GntR family transcriptional regulator [Enterococcus asini]
MQKYIYISNDIRNKILNGTYSANEQLPFEKELCVTYEASKMTVKKALDILVSEGLIIKRRGSGTFVKDLSIDEIERITVANQFRGTTALNPGKEVKSKVLSFSVIEAPELVISKLNLSPGSFVYDIYRARYIDGQPHVMEKTYMPIDQIPGLKKEHIEGSIYGYIEEQLGLTIQSAHRQITVRKADETEAEYLDLQAGDPVAVAEQIAYFDTGIAFEYSISVHRYDEFSVEMILTRD